MPSLDERNCITCAITCTNRSRHRRRRRGGPPGFEVCIDPPNFVMKAGRALYFLAFVILLSARGAVFRIAAFAVYPAKPLRAISAVYVIATAAKGEVSQSSQLTLVQPFQSQKFKGGALSQESHQKPSHSSHPMKQTSSWFLSHTSHIRLKQPS